jgi:hypothetical protein
MHTAFILTDCTTFRPIVQVDDFQTRPKAILRRFVVYGEYSVAGRKRHPSIVRLLYHPTTAASMM